MVSVFQPVPCSIAPIPSCNTAVFSVSNDAATIANDSGIEYTILTLASASDWNGQAFVSLNFQGAAGSPFLVHGCLSGIFWVRCVSSDRSQEHTFFTVQLVWTLVAAVGQGLLVAHKRLLKDFGFHFLH